MKTASKFGAAALLLAITAILPACSAQKTKDVVWPTVVKCAPEPSELHEDVADVLQGDPGDSLTERGLKALEQLARKHGPELVACAVNDIAERLGGAGDTDSVRVQSKARAFFARTRVAVEE